MDMNLNQFHHCDKDGTAIRVFDDAIVQYLVSTENLIVLSEVPYYYKDGLFRRDLEGIKAQAMIKKLIYRQFIRFDTIRRIYKLLLTEESINVEGLLTFCRCCRGLYSLKINSLCRECHRKRHGEKKKRYSVDEYGRVTIKDE